MNNILKELKDREIFNDITSEKKLLSLKEGAGVYIGFDPTADSLHLGNYIQISILKRFQSFGFKPFAVVGGATGMIGDPSGKNRERNLLSTKEIQKNKKAIVKQLKYFGLNVIDNYDFYKNVNILEFLRDIGKLLNVNYMINKDVVKSRLESGISFTEFSYQLIQGWDFKNLYENEDVMIQVGGSDQWGNITSGIEVIRKTIGDENKALGITTKLLTTSNGKKFGKSEGEAIWLEKSKTTPFQLYQYLYNTTDSDVEKLLLWLTKISVSDIKKLIKEHRKNSKLRVAQMRLAHEVVADIHSEKDALYSKELTKRLFGGGDITSLTNKEKLSLVGSIPTFEKVSGNVVDVLVEIKAASSKREAREFITSGSILVNGIKASLETEINSNKVNLIKRGKKKFFLIK